MRSREREAADLFFADLFGVRRRQTPNSVRASSSGRAVVAAPPRPPAANWERPDLIFDNYVHRSAEDGKAALGEAADEGWTVAAPPLSETPPETLRPGDVVIQRAMGDGRLATVNAVTDVDARTLYGPGGLIRSDTLVLRHPDDRPGFEPAAPGATFDLLEAEYDSEADYGDTSEDTPPAPSADAGETAVHLPLLTAHAAQGFTYNLSGPNCVLRWARVPRGFSGALDVVVHFHGYKSHNAMRLSDKTNASGLDLQTPGVAGPTLGLVPHGRAFASRAPNTDGFTFPAIASREGLQRFIDAALSAFKETIGSSERTLNVRRVILTGHSGGGAALNLLMRSMASGEGAHAFHYFDATYGGPSVITDARGWLRTALERDAKVLRDVSAEQRAQVMSERGGGLRIMFIDGTPTAATARTVDTFIDRALREIEPDEGRRSFLRRYYRAQAVVNPRSVGHSRVPQVFGGRLLADGSHALDPDARNLIVSRAPAEATAEDPPAAAPAPATPAIPPLDRVRSAIETTLNSFRSVLVAAPAPVGRDVAVAVPYFINKPTSPSRVRGEQRRPGLLRNEHLSRLYRALHFRARVGKAHPSDVRVFLQGAIDANAVPGQASGLSAVGLKSFLSDMGVGVDCSAFVSQALNACMAAFDRSERIDTNSANLRGGAGHNQQQFDLVSRPRDLMPGDTMWKTGHIRIIHRVEPQADGSIQFVTAESSSIDLIGAVAKTWKCPQADRFASMQVERAGTFQPSTEVNVFSRYRPLAEVLRPGRPAAEAEDTPPVAPPPAPTGSRPVPIPPPPTSVPTPAPTPAPTSTAAPATPGSLTQPEIERLARIEFASASDIDTFCSRRGAAGFAAWFNAQLSGRPPFQRANGGPLAMGTTPLVRQHFVSFWNSISVAYDRPRITALDFAALMCIVLNETGGDFTASPEMCGRGASDARGGHPGLAYAFDKIVGIKGSYNTLRGNRRAGDLFNDADYVRTHDSLAGGTRLANHGGDFGNAWNSEYYPQTEFSTAEHLAENGFIMQADFYKFRGRGIIQTTGRGAYLAVVDHIQRYSGANTVLLEFKRRWSALTRDVAATTSTNADWDLIFSQGPILARALRLHSGAGNNDYRTMSTQSATLLDVPAPPPPPPPRRVPAGVKGSIYFMGRRISGKYDYSAGPYRDRVLAMLRAMLAL